MSRLSIYLFEWQVEKSHQVFGRRLFGREVLSRMLIEAAHPQPQVPPALALRRLDVAQQQLQERGLAHAVRTYIKWN